MGSRGAAVALLLVLAAWGIGGCATTRFHQRERLADRAMQPDNDPSLLYLRDKVEAAREGALGGYGAAVAGGCGCQ